MGAILPIFVYGLLKPAQEGFAELRLDGRVEVIGPDRVTGSLYHLGEYPGLVPGGDGIVQGMLLRPLGQNVLADMDAYELYDPADPDESEYRRVEIITLAGVRAWTYAYNRDVKGCIAVPGNLWPPAP